MSRGLIEPTFKKYFSNYDEKKLEFSLLKGDLKVNNLFFNRDAINESLDSAMIPFQLKFGMISKLNIKISIIGLYIELIDIEDLILVLSPDATKTQRISERALDTDLKEAVLLHMLENHKSLIEKKPLQSHATIQGIPKQVVESMDKRKANGETPFAERGPILTTTDSNNQMIEKPKANLMGPEFFEIITGRLKFDIRVKNIRIYYEDGETLNLASGSGQKNFFSFCFNISELKLNTEDILSFCDGAGNFKDLFNINNLMSTFSQTSKLIYLNVLLQRACLEVYLGITQILPTTIDTDLKEREPSYFVDYFQKLNNRRRGDFVEIFIIDTLGVDIILAHDQNDTTSMPLQGGIMYTNIKEISFNVQLGIMAEITNIMNYVNSIKALNDISAMRPDLKVMTSKYMSQFASKHKLTREQIDRLKLINKELARETMAIPIWRDLFTTYAAMDNLDVKRRLTFRYRLSSLVYQLIHGQNFDQIKTDEKEFFAKERAYLDKLEELAKNEANKNNPQPAQPTAPEQPEDMRTKVDKQLSKVSKLSWKFHVHFRLHTNLFVNMLDANLKRELTVVLKGMDLNIVKPRGRFHVNIGFMLKYLLVSLNLKSGAKQVQRSIWEGMSQNQEDQRDSVKNGTGISMNSDIRAIVDNACIDYRRLKLNIDITTEEHVSKCLIPIITVTGESGELVLKLGVPIMKRLLEMKLAIDMQNLEAFRKASRGMKKLMEYRMSKAVTKIVKTHKGTEKAKDNFIKMMENITSFSKLNIPLRTLKRMEQKGILVSQSPQNHHSFSKLDLRKTNPKLHKELKEDYNRFYQEKQRKLEEDRLNVDPMTKAQPQLQKVSKVLEAFVLKMNFAFKKLFLSLSDERLKTIFELEADFGDITLIIDEVYSELHKFKFMGFRMESRKSVRVLGALMDSISANLQPLIKQIKEQNEKVLKNISGHSGV